MQPVTSNINDLKFTFNGKVYGLHHSRADLIPGKDRILPSGALTTAQTTAGDTTKGFTYFWDASTIDSITSAVHNQAKARNIYLVEAASVDDVLPDLNIAGESGRTIKGEMAILDKVSLPTNIGNGREARLSVLEMLRKHGIIPETKNRSRMIHAAYFLNKGEKALEEYIPARAQMEADSFIQHAQRINPQTGKIAPVFQEGGLLHDKYLNSLTESGRKIIFEEELAKGEQLLASHRAYQIKQARTSGFMLPINSNIGLSEINMDILKQEADFFADYKKNYGAGLVIDDIKGDIVDKQIIKARISFNRSRLATQESTGKGFKKAMSSSSLLEAAEDASKAVARRDSIGMKVAGAAATILRNRF